MRRKVSTCRIGVEILTKVMNKSPQGYARWICQRAFYRTSIITVVMHIFAKPAQRNVSIYSLKSIIVYEAWGLFDEFVYSSKKRVVLYVVDKISVDISNRESFNHPGIRVATEKIGN